MPRRTISDETHNHQRHHERDEDDEMLDIRSQIDMLHKMSNKIDDERKKNRIIVAMIGMLVLVAEIANIVTKLVLRDNK